MDWNVDWAFLIEMTINWFVAWNLNFEGWPYVRKEQRMSLCRGGLYEGFHCMKEEKGNGD